MNNYSIDQYIFKFIYHGLHKPINIDAEKRTKSLDDVLLDTLSGNVNALNIYQNDKENVIKKNGRYFEIQIASLLITNKRIIRDKKVPNRKVLRAYCLSCLDNDPCSMLALYVLARLFEVDKDQITSLEYFQKLASCYSDIHYFQSMAVSRLINDKKPIAAIAIINTYKSKSVQSLCRLDLKLIHSKYLLRFINLAVFLITILLGPYKLYWFIFLIVLSVSVYLFGIIQRDSTVKLLGIMIIINSILFYIIALVYLFFYNLIMKYSF
jgi:hypothetical protein